MPPLPSGVLDAPAEPGLRVIYAGDGFLLATKLIAQRAKDADDVIALARRLGLATATPEQLEAHIRTYYTDEASLEFIVDGGNDVDRKIALLAQDASSMLNRAASVNAQAQDAGADRLGVSRRHEQREPPTPGDQPPQAHPPRR